MNDSRLFWGPTVNDAAFGLTAIVFLTAFGHAAWRCLSWFLDVSARRYEKKHGVAQRDAGGALLLWAGVMGVICWLIYGLWGLLQCSLGYQDYCSGG